MSDDPGRRFATALAAKDFVEIRGLFSPAVDFRGMTPGRTWEACDPDEVVEVLRTWFEPQDDIKTLLTLDTGRVVDTHHVGYRFAVTTPDGDHQVEQQAYLRVGEGGIVWMRVLCSGFRRVG